MASSPDDNFFLPWLHGWNKEFTTRQNVKHHGANKPYVAVVQGATQPLPESDIIAYFVNTDESEMFPDTTASQIEDFCPNARRVEDLENPAAVKIPVALLDDSDSNCRRRTAYRYKLVAKQLYEALQKPRLRRRRVGSVHIQDVSDCLLIKTDPSEDNIDELREPDAERRLVYITNLDEWTVLVLAATASYHEAQALRRGIRSHLEFNATIDVVISPESLSTFTMSFHLPFYALRTCASPMRDHRLKSDGRPLRQYQDITFVDSDCQESIYLYESQVSCIVTGWDCCVWTAYLFIDLYYDGDGQESLEEYEGQFEQLDGSETICDPLLRGEGTPKPIREPREYFLRCFEVRSRMVVNAWHQLAIKVLKDIKATRESYRCSSRSKSNVKSTPKTDDDRLKRKEFFLWSNQVMELLKKLSKGLEESIIAWTRFSAGSVRCFHSPGSEWNISERDQRRLLAIQHHFTQMSILQRRLRDMSDEFRDITKDYTIPFAVAAAFLSTRDGFFPVPENPASFLILLGIIEILVFLMFDKLSNWKTCGAFTRQIYEKVGRRRRGKLGIGLQTGDSTKQEEV